MKIEEELIKLKGDVKWIKIITLALLAVALSGFHVADPTLIPWHWP